MQKWRISSVGGKYFSFQTIGYFLFDDVLFESVCGIDFEILLSFKRFFNQMFSLIWVLV